jgi:uncharacterized membrane protein YbhN (UPF0104 family)
MRISRRQALRSAGSVIAALSLLYIALQLHQAWPQLAGIELAAGPALLALLCGGLSLVTYALLWRGTLLRLGAALNRPAALRIWFASQLVRYAPGNIWHLLGRAYLAGQAGVPAQPLSMSMVLELLQTITAALVVAALSLLFWRQGSIMGLWTLLLAPLLACYCWPQLLQRPLAWALRRVGQAPDSAPLRRRDLFALLPGYCATWLIYGLGLYLLARSIYPLPPAALPGVAGSFAIAWVVGFLSLITPSGLGVREGVLGVLLSTFMPTPVALLLALLARIWLTVAELACAALVVWRRS